MTARLACLVSSPGPYFSRVFCTQLHLHREHCVCKMFSAPFWFILGYFSVAATQCSSQPLLAKCLSVLLNQFWKFTANFLKGIPPANFEGELVGNFESGPLADCQTPPPPPASPSPTCTCSGHRLSYMILSWWYYDNIANDYGRRVWWRWRRCWWWRLRVFSLTRESRY